ncbi:28686_t:CDS:10, partial [Dentiscutata erythropus]
YGYRTLYSSSKNTLPFNKFHVNSSYEGGLVFKVIDDTNVNRYKSIYTILPNGTTIDINFDFPNYRNISISRIYPLTMKLYLLLYDNIVMVASKSLECDLFVVNGTIEKNPSLNLILDTRLYSFLIYSQSHSNVVSWTLYNLQKQDNIGVIASNSFNLSDFSTLEYVFPIVDGSYGFVISDTTTNSITDELPNSGNTCMMTTEVDVNNIGSTIITYQIDFLSSGSVVNLQSRYKQFLSTSDGQIDFNIKQLFYGGSIITSWTFKCVYSEYVAGFTSQAAGDCEPKNLTGYIIPPDGNEEQWDLLPISSFSNATFDPVINIVYYINRCIETKPEMHSDSAVVVVRLTHDGTIIYDSLSSSNKSLFLSDLQNEIIESIPTTSDRLHLTNRIQYDPSTSSSQYLLQIEVLAPNDNYQTPVYQIINDMDTLIREKDTSIMSMNNHTKYLDSSYGVTVNLNFWDEMKFKLLGVLSGFAVLSIIALIACCKCREGCFTIFSITFILSDLIMDILFVVKNGNDVPWLYKPSIFILTLSVLFNLVAAIKLITSELRHKNFSEWFDKNTKVVSIFTILSIADIALLECLTSNFGGFQFFNAPFSDNIKNQIFWGTTINVFIENITQFVIQLKLQKEVLSHQAFLEKVRLNFINNIFKLLDSNDFAVNSNFAIEWQRSYGCKEDFDFFKITMIVYYEDPE